MELGSVSIEIVLHVVDSLITFAEYFVSGASVKTDREQRKRRMKNEKKNKGAIPGTFAKEIGS